MKFWLLYFKMKTFVGLDEIVPTGEVPEVDEVLLEKCWVAEDQ